MLNELDKELEHRGHPFVRYADDALIFCKSKRAAKRVKASITRFIESKLHLKVNNEKTVVSYVRGVKYLGYSFYVMKGKCQLTVHPKSKAKMKSRLKELTSRSNGWGYAKRKQKLKEYIKGWVGYYHLANMKRLLLETDEWLRRRIRKVLRGIEGKADLSSPELKDFADSLNIAISQDGHQLVLASKNAECDMDELSVADVKMLDKWIEKCKDVESFDLSDKSHEDRAWKRAKRQADKTGEDSKITMYDMAAAAGASKDMLCIIRDRQSVQKALSWI